MINNWLIRDLIRGLIRHPNINRRWEVLSSFFYLSVGVWGRIAMRSPYNKNRNMLTTRSTMD